MKNTKINNQVLPDDPRDIQYMYNFDEEFAVSIINKFPMAVMFIKNPDKELIFNALTNINFIHNASESEYELLVSYCFKRNPRLTRQWLRYRVAMKEIMKHEL